MGVNVFVLDICTPASLSESGAKAASEKGLFWDSNGFLLIWEDAMHNLLHLELKMVLESFSGSLLQIIKVEQKCLKFTEYLIFERWQIGLAAFG